MNRRDKSGLIAIPKYDSFESLPAWAKNAILKFCSDDGATWASKAIPALEGKSFLEVMSREDGEEKAKSYLRNVIGKFFPGEVLDV